MSKQLQTVQPSLEKKRFRFVQFFKNEKNRHQENLLYKLKTLGKQSRRGGSLRKMGSAEDGFLLSGFRTRGHGTKQRSREET